ncbi:MAG: glycosyltransferase [Anaerolineae bacterium]|nr:glycosyltransferase [Anaerolineae bacterium]
MRFLFVSLYPVGPGVMHSGGQTLFQLIAHLSRQHTVHLAAFGDAPAAALMDTMRGWCESVRLVVPAVGWRAKLAQARREPRFWRWGRRAHAEMSRCVAELSKRVDVVQFVWTPMGRYAPHACMPGCARVLDCVDVNFVVLDARRKTGGMVDRLRAAPAYWRERARETAYARACDLALTRSARDARALAAASGREALAVPPFVARTAFAAVRAEDAEDDIVLFAGAMSRARNVAAVTWFCREVWPRVHAARPAAEFYIVGAQPAPAVQALGALPGVHVTGAVDDLAPWYARCRVAVAPMQSDAGTLTKIIEAMWAGRPVVATSPANAGIGAPPGEAIYVADDAEAFARHILRLLEMPGDWARIAAGGRRFAEVHLDWETALGRLEAAYARLAAR